MRPVEAVEAGAPPVQVSSLHQLIIMGILLGACLFNTFLAFVNANVAALSSAPVIAFELLITCAALAIGVQRVDANKARWFVLMGFLVFFQAFTAITNGQPDPKFLRDVLIIPVFMLLGLSSDRPTLLRALIILQAVVLAFTLYEAFAVDSYSKLLGVKSYYINTRGFKADSFYQKGSELFVSAQRPGERFLPFFGIHRVSSVFLEPVSLGNYAVIAWMIMLAMWSQMSWMTRGYLVFSTVIILFGCDGRFATVTIGILTGMRVIVPFLPRFSNWLYLPLVLIVAAIASSLLNWQPDGDNFSSRTAFTLDILASLDAGQIFGGDSARAYRSADSGVSYILLSQSFLGLLVIWSFISIGVPQNDRPTLFYAHAVSAYIALNSLISYSMFSIKTAALLWFAYGALQSLQASQPAAAPPYPRLRRGGSRYGNREGRLIGAE
ncbi:MAG TPA: hypothetical protein VLA00_03850 [Xanthobacteraceae bacterium]|nr:hypothetical protein [Xanthobacteraceae bacterium]